MRIPGIGRLGGAVRRLKRRFDRKAVILLYHRIAEVDSDPWSLCVNQHHFAEHLEVLRQHFCPMGLQQLVQGLQNGRSADRAVAVTFDDGYADNLYNAKPLLEQYGVPATIFVTTGYVGHDREFWWDELERLLLQPGTLPRELRLSVNGNTFHWELGGATHYSEQTYQRLRCWYIEKQKDPTPRHSIYRTLWQLLYTLHDGERRKVLDELLAWGNLKPAVRATHRPLSPGDVVKLVQGYPVEVGAHTVTHPSLRSLPSGLQQREIQESKKRLEEIIERPVTSFAYPHGAYTGETVALVREAGFTCACSSVADMVWRATDYFELPRFQVQNWNGEEFARRLWRVFR